MALSITRLRRWFALLALAAVAVVAVFYVRARIELHRTLRNLPAKVGIGIQQTSEGFTLSKSEGGRTLFTIHASKATQFKLGGRAALHDVRIVVYGRRSDRFDQIYGSDFEYDPASSTISSQGQVQIDLESRDQAETTANATPLKPNEDLNVAPENKGPVLPNAASSKPGGADHNPIHLRAEGLTFNQKSGVAESQGRVDFQVAQGVGTARGISYDSKKNGLILHSDIDIQMQGQQATHIVARSGTVTKEPRELTLEGAQIHGDGRTLEAQKLVAYFGSDNAVERMEAEGNVRLSDAGRTLLADKAVAQMGARNTVQRVEAEGNVRLSDTGGLQLHAPKGEMVLTQHGGAKNALDSAWFGGGVDFKSSAQGSEGHAGEMRLLFATAARTGEAALRTIHASQNVVLRQIPGEGSHNAQAMTMTSDAMTFAVDQSEPSSKAGRQVWGATQGKLRLTSAETAGPGQLTIESGGNAARPAGKGVTGQTIIDARQFRAEFGEDSRLRTLHGTGTVQVTTRTPGEPDKVSTSDTLLANFSPAGEITHAVQEGNFRYREHQSSKSEPGGRSITARRASYSPADDSMTLTGEPRIVDGGTTIAADNIRLLRESGESFATGNVKTTYSQLTVQPNGALLTSSEPVHVTARAMNALQSPGLAHYTGGARLWQGSNVVEAQSIDFDEKARTIVATGDAQHPVTSVFVQVDKGKSTTVLVSAPKLSYEDNQRQAHYWGGVTAKSADGVLTAGRMDILLTPATSGTARGGVTAGPSQLERIIASTRVVVQQAARRVEGDKLVYEAAKGTYVMTGGPPVLSDPVNGTVRGDSLTFYSRDDRVVVEGGDNSRAVTHTHISR